MGSVLELHAGKAGNASKRFARRCHRWRRSKRQGVQAVECGALAVLMGPSRWIFRKRVFPEVDGIDRLETTGVRRSNTKATDQLGSGVRRRLTSKVQKVLSVFRLCFVSRLPVETGTACKHKKCSSVVLKPRDRP